MHQVPVYGTTPLILRQKVLLIGLNACPVDAVGPVCGYEEAGEDLPLLGKSHDDHSSMKPLTLHYSVSQTGTDNFAAGAMPSKPPWKRVFEVESRGCKSSYIQHGTKSDCNMALLIAYIGNRVA